MDVRFDKSIKCHIFIETACHNEAEMEKANAAPAATKRIISKNDACGTMHNECCLRDMPEGAHARVRDVRGCARVRSRLCSLGFTPGTQITVYGRGANGCRVQVRDTCVVLDCDVAESIVCDFLPRGVTVAEACDCGCHARLGAVSGDKEE